ncbi:MAG: ADOP family duplicated permease [Vicinamibacterales bacterium]
MTPRGLVRRLWALVRAERLDHDLDEEIAVHLELAERDLVAAGHAPQEARRLARARFGGLTRIREEHRDRRSVRWIEHAWRDVRYGLAAMGRTPGFSAVVVGVLALGIGATAAMFTVLDAVLLRPLPFPAPDRIVHVWEAPSPGSRNSSTVPEFLEWRRLGSSFEALAAEDDVLLTLSGRGEPARVPGKAVTGAYFDVFGLRPVVGRALRAGDAEPGASAVVVLSHAAWQAWFGGAPDVLAREMTLDGVPHRVVGVLPPGVFDRSEAAVWVPLVFTPAQQQDGRHWLTVFGRLEPGISVVQAEAQIRAIDAAISPPERVADPERTMRVAPLQAWLTGDSLPRTILLVFGAALVVLLVACANVASLLLARGATRRRELAVRAALGAGRGRLLAQLFAETLVLCVLGAGAGIGLAYALLAFARPVIQRAVPYTAEVRLDLRVVAFTALTTMLVAAIVGILPALHTRFDALVRTLNQGARGASGPQGRLRRVMVVAEVALSLVLIASAGLLMRSVLSLRTVDPGVRVAGVTAMDADLPINLYPGPDDAARAYAAIAERVAAVPGVAGVGITSHLPLLWIGNGEGLRVSQAVPWIGVRLKRIDPGYLEALGIPLIAGRDIVPSDGPASERVVLLNDTLAARVGTQLDGADPVGRLVTLTLPTYAGQGADEATFRIVGVIRSERVDAPWRPDPPVAYVPIAQVPTAAAKLIVRAASDTTAVIPAVRAAAREVAPGVPLGVVTTMADVQDGTFGSTSRPARVIGAFAVAALLLSALGLYGVLAHLVTERRREIGIRVALGARTATVVVDVLRTATGLVLTGVGLGLAGTMAATRAIGSLLHGVSPLDPAAVSGACAVMLAAGLLAAFLPARRAARVDPVRTLREE